MIHIVHIDVFVTAFITYIASVDGGETAAGMGRGRQGTDSSPRTGAVWCAVGPGRARPAYRRDTVRAAAAAAASNDNRATRAGYSLPTRGANIARLIFHRRAMSYRRNFASPRGASNGAMKNRKPLLLATDGRRRSGVAS